MFSKFAQGPCVAYQAKILHGKNFSRVKLFSGRELFLLNQVESITTQSNQKPAHLIVGSSS